MDEVYVVYVRADERGRIAAVTSSAFLDDSAGWTEIDRGSGVRFRHAQGNYFPTPIRSEDGIALYKLVEGGAAARTAEEIEADRAAMPAPAPTELERIEAQVVWTALMTDTLLED